MTRDQRQQLVIKNWIATKGKGTCELPTGLYYFNNKNFIQKENIIYLNFFKIQPFCKGIYRIIIGQYRGKA